MLQKCHISYFLMISWFFRGWYSISSFYKSQTLIDFSSYSRLEANSLKSSIFSPRLVSGRMKLLLSLDIMRESILPVTWVFLWVRKNSYTMCLPLVHKIRDKIKKWMSLSFMLGVYNTWNRSLKWNVSLLDLYFILPKRLLNHIFKLVYIWFALERKN